MANTYTNLNDLFSAIATSIKNKKDSSESIVADNFPTEIRDLRTGFEYNNQMTTSITDYQFYNCTDLKSVDCVNLQSIGANAFEGCSNLKSIILYNDVTSVGENAFKDCNSELKIYCEATSKPEGWHENWNFNGYEVVWDCFEPIETWNISATENDNVVVSLCNDIHNEGMYLLNIDGSGKMEDYTNESSVHWYNYRNNIKNAVISNGVTSIGNYAFKNCTSLTSITIPDGVTSIRNGAFYGCSSLTSITYIGTITQWKTIIFGDNWNYKTGKYTIHCTDGDIKGNTITYHNTGGVE